MSYLLVGVVFLFVVAYAAYFSFKTRGILPYARLTDNMALAEGARHFRFFKWPSLMHQGAGGKARMKEFAAVCLALVMRFTGGQPKSDYPLVLLCIFCHSLSSLLVFWLAQKFFGTSVGLATFGFFFFSFWHTQIVLWGGVVAVAQLATLISISFSILGAQTSGWTQWIYFFASGIFFGVCFFSSASARKYFPYCVTGFSWALLNQFDELRAPQTIVHLSVAFAGAFIFTKFGLRRGLGWLIKKSFSGELKGIWRFELKGRETLTLDHYEKKINALCASLVLPVFVVLALTISGMRANEPKLYWSLVFAFLLGISLSVIYLTFPHFLSNLKQAYVYSQYGTERWRSRFYYARPYMAERGFDVSENFRGAGIPWLLKFGMATIPFQLCLTAASLFAWIGAFMFFDLDASLFIQSLFVLAFALTPVLIGEWTNGVQVGRAYYPSLLGFAFYFCFTLGNFGNLVNASFAFLLGALIHGALAIWKDILPARMATSDVLATCKELGIRELQTPKTVFNDSVADVLSAFAGDSLNLRQIESYADVSSEWLLLPGLNRKSLLLSDFDVALRPNITGIDQGFVRLSERLQNGSEFEAVKFEGFGSSRYWHHESEFTSFRDLIMNELSESDLKFGWIWLVRVGAR